MRFQIDMLRHTRGPKRYREMVSSVTMLQMLRVSFPCVVLLVLSVVVYMVAYIPRERPVKALEQEVKQLNSQIDVAGQTNQLMRQEIDTLSKLRCNTLVWVDILISISSTIPEDLWITRLETYRIRANRNGGEQVPGIIIQGSSASADMHLATLARFMDRLSHEPPIYSTFCIQDWSTKSPKRGGDVVDFEIRLERKKSG